MAMEEWVDCYYFKKNRIEYYDRLMNVRQSGNWEDWIKFFLKGISEVSDEATNTAKDIIALKTRCEQLLVNSNTNSLRLLDLLFESPFISKNKVADRLSIASPTAGKLVEEFCRLGILLDDDPTRIRYKRYVFAEYITILNRGTEL